MTRFHRCRDRNSSFQRPKPQNLSQSEKDSALIELFYAEEDRSECSNWDREEEHPLDKASIEEFESPLLEIDSQHTSVVLNVITGRLVEPTGFHLTLNTRQAVIRRHATWTLARNATFLKLTHRNTSLVLLIPSIRSHIKLLNTS